MKVLMVSGSWPPDACGVGDYAHRLVAALREAGVDVDVLNHPLNLAAFRTVDRTIERSKSDIVHLQYPTVGFGAHLGPHALSLRRPGVVTLHESSRLHPLRRWSLGAFTWRSRRLIFTTSHERDFVARRAPWIRDRTAVIPVGSSIAAAEVVPKTSSDILSFGLFRPGKGWEEVLQLAALIRARGDGRRLRWIGVPDPRKMDYYHSLRHQAEGLPVDWEVGLSDAEVSAILARSRLAYMPFPDGALDYRTSLLALLANGVAVVTTRSPRTPPALAEAVAFADTPEIALDVLTSLMADADRQSVLADRGRTFVRGVSWASIAARHLRLYEELLAAKRR